MKTFIPLIVHYSFRVKVVMYTGINNLTIKLHKLLCVCVGRGGTESEGGSVVERRKKRGERGRRMERYWGYR